MRSRSGRARLGAVALGLAAVFGNFACSGPPETPRPILVLALDGAEWSVIEELWSRGELPHLAALAERGARGELRTAYSSKSPVVWTTIATGVTPDRHGIEDFVVTTERGDVPVTSTARKVPAIWNMLSAVGRRAAVLGWWASWPSEEIEGVVLSDRAARDVERRTHPTEWWAELDLEAELRGADLFPPGVARDQDELVTAAARRTVKNDFDLQLVYLRSVDTMSHTYWRYFRPERYPELPPEELARYADRIPRAYAAVDRVLGELVAAVGSEHNVIVLSDHGFYGMKRERRRVACRFDTVLARLGFLKRRDGAIDPERTRVYSHRSPHAQPTKLLRTPGRATLQPDAAAPRLTKAGRELERELADALARVRYGDGSPLFGLRLPEGEELDLGAELVVDVLQPQGDESVRLDGEALEGVVEIERLSGSHGGSTHGIFIAAGPDIDPDADLDGLRIHDVTPTLLYGLGLPVARDFDGRAWTPLFRPEFREAFPLRAIPSWGARDASGATATDHDPELLDELRALGYL